MLDNIDKIISLIYIERITFAIRTVLTYCCALRIYPRRNISTRTKYFKFFNRRNTSNILFEEEIETHSQPDDLAEY